MTLSDLLKKLAAEYGTSGRPKRYFDVPKRGDLTASEVRYVKKRFKELVERERCVESDPDNPECYAKVSTDLKPKMRKRKSSYLADYEEIYRSDRESLDAFFEGKKLSRSQIPKGVRRIAIETGLPEKELYGVYKIGVGAYSSSGSRTGMSAEQWGYGRLYAFVMSYFHNESGKYNNRRFLKNKTDFQIFEKILEDML
jgi:hypothetical protein